MILSLYFEKKASVACLMAVKSEISDSLAMVYNNKVCVTNLLKGDLRNEFGTQENGPYC